MVSDKQETKERLNDRYSVVVIQGLADLGDGIAGMFANVLGGQNFDPKWGAHGVKEVEAIKTKLERFHELVENEKKNGKELIVVSISAGTAFVVSYLLKYGYEGIAKIISVNGLINADLNDETPIMEEKLGILARDREGFRRIASFNTAQFEHQPEVKEVLSKIVEVYYSPNDEIVPKESSAPDWIPEENKTIKSKSRNHVIGIAAAMIEVKKEIDKLRKAKF